MSDDLGATGKFPLGKLNRDDEGEIRLAIGTVDRTVVIRFGKPTAWIGFTATQARMIADTLNAHADALDPLPDPGGRPNRVK